MDEIIDQLALAEMSYDGFLTTGFFGTQLYAFLMPDNELKWWGILLIILLGLLVVGVFESARSEGGGIGVSCRNLVSIFLLLAVISGTTGVLFFGVVEAWAILEMIYIVSTWMEKRKH